MDKLDRFDYASERIRELDHQGHALFSDAMLRQYIARNSFGMDPETKLHRIFQREYLEADIASGQLTLPSASSALWNDPLENPLADVSARDDVTGGLIDYGTLVRSYHALCWTRMARPRQYDWESFSHGKPATRISVSAKALMDRIVTLHDSNYMHRAWLVDVDYKKPEHIQGMKTPQAVIDRLESPGASLALSAATVRSKHIDEDEVRLLYDVSFTPLPPGALLVPNQGLVRVRFDWTDFIEEREDGPAGLSA